MLPLSTPAESLALDRWPGFMAAPPEGFAFLARYGEFSLIADPVLFSGSSSG